MENKDIDEIFEGLFSVLPVFRKKVHRISDEILRGKEISRAHFHIMKSLRREGPLTMTDLGRLLSVSKPNITILVDKLVKFNLVTRKFDENDRRLTYIELTEYGNEYLDKYLESMKVALSENMQKFNKEDLALFKETINNMKVLIDRMIEEE